MPINNGDVVTVMTVSGGEYVGKLVSNDAGVVTLDNPRFVTMNEQGSLGFAGGIVMTGVKDPKEVTLYNVLFVAETNPEVVTAYRTAVSGIITPPAGKFQV